MLRVTYARVADLRQDLEGQLRHGGLLVQVVPAGLTLGSRVPLEIVAPDGTVVNGEGEVLHVLPHGVALTFPAAGIAELRALAAACADGDAPGPPRHERVEAASPGSRRREAAPGEPRRIEGMSTAEKIQVALHGSRDERAAILRDRNRQIHVYVLKNPQLTADEVVAIAKNTNLSPELLGQIAERKEWLQRPAVALALVRNPKTPQGAGIRALDFVPISDLRQIAKGNLAPPHITEAAKRKIIKP